jgi:hypothetical protein
MATGHKLRLAFRLCLCYSQRDISTSSPSLHYHYFPVWQFALVSICPCEHLSLWAIILVSINPCEHSSMWAYIRVSIYRCGYFSCEHSWQWGFICAQLSCGLLSWNRLDRYCSLDLCRWNLFLGSNTSFYKSPSFKNSNPWVHN